MTERVWASLLRPVDSASAAAFRILFGLVMCGAMLRLLATGWIDGLFVRPAFFFRYPGLEWVPLVPAELVHLHVVLLAVLAAMIAAGILYRAACGLFTVGFAWLELVDVTNYLNHYYLVVVVAALMTVLPLHRTWSLDALWRPRVRGGTVPAAVVYLLRFQIGVVYVFAGLAKFGTDWLLHAQPLGLWLSARADTPVIGPLLGEPLVAYVMSWAGFLFDGTIVLWLLHRRTRLVAYGVLCTFHFFTHVLFDIGIFPVVMTTCALIFFPADWPRRLLAIVRVNVPGSPPVVATCGPLIRPQHRALALLAAVWCAFHVLMPLRHYATAGNVIWDEVGMRWSWKVMLREKQGSITYRVRDPRSGREWEVPPSRYLNARQAKEMSGQPDLIVQLAHRVAEDARVAGIPDPEVRVDAWVSLNGRPAARLLSGEADLLTASSGSFPTSWILPEPTSAPPSPFARTAQPLAAPLHAEMKDRP